MDALEWTSKAPSAAGIFWTFRRDEITGKPIISLVNVTKSMRGFLVAEFFGHDGEFELSKFSKWMGPLPVPGE